jgi:hypothetical protein
MAMAWDEEEEEELGPAAYRNEKAATIRNASAGDSLEKEEKRLSR